MSKYLNGQIVHISTNSGPAYSQEEPGCSVRTFQVKVDGWRNIFVRGAKYCNTTPDLQRHDAAWSDTFHVGDEITFNPSRIDDERVRREFTQHE